MNTKELLFRGGEVYDSDLKAFVSASILIRNGKIEQIIRGNELPSDIPSVDVSGKYIIPGLVDVHTHGRAGFDFNDAPADKYGEIALSYARVGTTTVMPTLASAPLDSLESSVKAIAEYGNFPGAAAFAGVHLEGRYLSPKKRGAHAEELLALPSADEIRCFRALAPTVPMRLSMAPELSGADDMIRAAVDLGVTVSAAHTDADFNTLKSAVAAGVTGFTHTFNAMRPIHHRDPGGAGAALLTDGAFAEFICDGHHIAPEIIKLSWRVKAHDKFVLITDSMQATGCADGEYSIAGLPVFVKNGLAVNSEGALSGSTLNLFDGMCNFMRFCDLTLEEAIPCATENPAKMIGVDDICGAIRPGLRADLIVLTGKCCPTIHSVFAGGDEVSNPIC